MYGYMNVGKYVMGPVDDNWSRVLRVLQQHELTQSVNSHLTSEKIYVQPLRGFHISSFIIIIINYINICM